MFRFASLKNLLFEEDGNCLHDSSKKLTLAEAVDREGKILRVYFCAECSNYKWKDIRDENWDEKVLSKLKDDKYHVYSTLEYLPLLKKFWER
jgi:hypothetical protein